MHAEMASSNSKPPPPAEIQFDEKWDRLIDTSLRRVVYGTLAGSLVALSLLRGPMTRTAAIAFGAGCGAGSAWTTCSKDVSRNLVRGRGSSDGVRWGACSCAGARLCIACVRACVRAWVWVCVCCCACAHVRGRACVCVCACVSMRFLASVHAHTCACVCSCTCV